ncbi:flagellar hook-associated protein FlgK [Paenibacillus thermotolerans]|uniref:flagellar hook-associated protein FlgK n=1 Tax=Paenibacillus thermotolerans TaxID=3027807 RepID=UPI002367D300|nr:MULTISPECIES: flagellar hook-associated protein FlgK [unclassified Paenibacillus]
MRSTFSGLEVAKRALFSQQTALQTTGHNIANANTKGYTRQIVNLTASRPLEAPGLMRSNTPGQLGQGVEFDSIKRIREGFLDQQFYHENKNLGSWTVRKDALEKLESILNEPSETGVRQVIENFWNAWQVVSKEPENATARAALKESAIALSDGFNHTSKQFQDLAGDLTENITVKLNEANQMLTQVARLNQEIFRVEGLGNSANDLRDQRDLLADDLSKILGVTVREAPGGYDISLGGAALVTGIEVNTVLTPADMEAMYQSGQLDSGEVHGMIYSRDEYVASYQFQLDSMVKVLVEGEVEVTLPQGTVVPKGTVINGVPYNGDVASRTLGSDTKVKVKGINGLHALGYTLDDPPKSGVPFFTMKDGYTTWSAASLQLNPDIKNKVSNIATSGRVIEEGGVEKVVKGNNIIALELAGLRNKRFDFEPSPTGTPILTNGSFDEFYRAMVGQLGVQAQEANRQQVNQKALVDQVEGRRQSVSGVSLDEEMANLIKYQHAYNAAARAMTSNDEILDKVINGMGVVGR